MVMPLFSIAWLVVEPAPVIVLVSPTVAAFVVVRLQFEIVLLSLPVEVPVLNQIQPPLVVFVVAVKLDIIVQFVIVLLTASAINLIVLVPLVALTVVLVIVNELPHCSNH